MKEALFVKHHSQKWAAYERMEGADPDELARRFIELTDDLAYAKTFYPQSKTTAYLNGLTANFHQQLYKNKRESSRRLITFWTTELPLLFKKNERQLGYAFLFFFVFALIGAFSAKYDDQFVRMVMGDSYVNMTNENIARGDPFGVYKSDNSFTMFFSIAANNIFVAFITFASGLLVSVGTVGYLVRNAVMLGSFEYFFFSRGLGWESVLVIWIHGTLEISAIVIAGAAGMVLGNSILFPGTYSRIVSFRRGAREGMQMVVGLVPVFLLAAFLESFVTRHTEMPVALSISILVLSFCFIVGYVILYPNWLAAKQRKITVPDTHGKI